MNHLQGMIGELNLKIQNEVFCVYQLHIYVPSCTKICTCENLDACMHA
jgi:hypothetical protein